MLILSFHCLINKILFWSLLLEYCCRDVTSFVPPSPSQKFTTISSNSKDVRKYVRAQKDGCQDRIVFTSSSKKYYTGNQKVMMTLNVRIGDEQYEDGPPVRNKNAVEKEGKTDSKLALVWSFLRTKLFKQKNGKSPKKYEKNNVDTITLETYENGKSAHDSKKSSNEKVEQSQIIPTTTAAFHNSTVSDPFMTSDNSNSEKGYDEQIEPTGPRWAMAAKDVNLTGTWKPVVNSKFKSEYDEYLKCCGQNMIFRNLAVNVLGFVTEIIVQNGTSLYISGTTPAGSWERTLISSGTRTPTIPISDDDSCSSFEPIFVTVVDPDGDSVQVESYWEDKGHIHTSLLRGKPRVEGGVFETRRYLKRNNDAGNQYENNSFLVCESFFHPSSKSKNKRFRAANITWTFEKVD